MKNKLINTLASKPLRLENAQNITRIKNLRVKFHVFSRRNGSFIFPPKGGAQKRKD